MADERATYEIRLRDKFSQGFSKIDSRVNRFESRIDRVNGRKGLGGFSSGLATAARWAGSLGLAIGAAGLAKSIVTLGVNMEQTRVAFATMFGTVEAGNKVIDQLNEFANVTPFDNNKVIQSAKTLAAFGFQADELRPTLKLLGDVSAGTGKDLAEMAVIFGQIKSAGRLMGQDLLQLINAGFNPLQEISERTGKSVATLKKEMEKGLISFDMVKGAFASATSEGGKFFNLMEKQSKTVGGRFSTLIGKLQMIGISLGEKLLPTLSDGLDVLLDIVEVLPKLNFSGFTSSINDLLRSFGDLSTNFNSLINAFGLSTDKVSGFQRVVDVLAISFRMSLAPIRLFIEGINIVKDLAKSTIDTFSGFGDVIIGAFTFDSELIKRGFEKANAAAAKGIKDINKRIQNYFYEEGKFALGFFKNRQEKTSAGLDSGGMTTTGTTGGKTGVKTATPKSVSSSISGSSPKNVTLNITKLVETINFTSQNWQQNKTQMVEEIKRALLVGLNDVVIANS